MNYGYGDAVPDGAAEKYGYSDAQTDYGYGDGAPSASTSAVDYGYGDAAPTASRSSNEAVDYGYSDAQTDYGYGDATPDGANDEERKPRTRRRNSVTRYSLVCQDKVVNEFNAHANIIDQFRNGSANAPSGPSPSDSSQPLNDTQNESQGSRRAPQRSSSGSSDSVDASGKKKKRGWGLFGRGGSNHK
ncbi:MAG: hypothetical protein SGILL_002037 [Bacillariaceae sp.]